MKNKVTKDILLNKEIPDFTNLIKDKNISNDVIQFILSKTYNPEIVYSPFDDFPLEGENLYFFFIDIKEILNLMDTMALYKFDSIKEIQRWLSTQKSIQNCICFLQLKSLKEDIYDIGTKWTDDIKEKLEEYMLLGWEIDNTKYDRDSLIIITDAVSK